MKAQFSLRGVFLAMVFFACMACVLRFLGMPVYVGRYNSWCSQYTFFRCGGHMRPPHTFGIYRHNRTAVVFQVYIEPFSHKLPYCMIYESNGDLLIQNPGINGYRTDLLRVYPIPWFLQRFFKNLNVHHNARPEQKPSGFG